VVASPLKLKLLFPDRFDVPPLCEENITQLFDYFLHSGTPLPFCTSDYLKRLSLSHFRLLAIDNASSHSLDINDLDMYLLGEISPYSCIMASYYLSRPQFSEFLNVLCLPPDRKDYQHYNAILLNRIEEEARIVNPNDEKTALTVFDHLCQKPFYRDEPYFIAGVETSKLLYQSVLDGVDKILDFDIGPHF